MRIVARASILAVLALAGCEGPPDVPAHPSWGDVAPILQGECNHCHGATAHTTGSLGPATYRFDFFDMNDAVCGDAAAAMDVPALAAASAPLIKADVTPSGGRPKMPPAPGRVLADWERQIIQRWADAPVKGPPPPGNRRPRIRINSLPSSARGQLSFVATTDDPDNDSVIGVIELEGLTVTMDHPGSFAVRLDLGDMPAGTHRLTAVLCDGWGSAVYDLGPIRVER